MSLYQIHKAKFSNKPCVNCRQLHKAHVSEQCLFMPTKYTPMNRYTLEALLLWNAGKIWPVQSRQGHIIKKFVFQENMTAMEGYLGVTIYFSDGRTDRTYNENWGIDMRQLL